jgi:hypothetical protein
MVGDQFMAGVPVMSGAEVRNGWSLISKGPKFKLGLKF